MYIKTHRSTLLLCLCIIFGDGSCRDNLRSILKKWMFVIIIYYYTATCLVFLFNEIYANIYIYILLYLVILIRKGFPANCQQNVEFEKKNCISTIINAISCDIFIKYSQDSPIYEVKIIH